MAIQIAITDNKGVVTNYHRIGVFAPDFTQNVVSINLFGYADAAHRAIDKAAGTNDMVISSTGITLPLAANDTYTRETLYTQIMALPEFAGSTKAEV